MHRALVTGVTGFVGSHLARGLLGRDVEVHAVVRVGARLDRIPDLVDRIVVHVDDGTHDALHAAVADAAPDATFHLATNFVAEHSGDDVPALVADNVAFPARLADALAGGASAGDPHAFVNVGTAWQHVDGARYRPKNLYAATKQAFEDILRYYTDRDLLRAATVNLYDSYGPLDHRRKLLAALLAALHTGDVLAMSSGVQLIDLVHVDDVVRALLLAGDLCATAPASGEGDRVFAVSSGRPRTLRELVEVLGVVAGHPVPVAWGARPDRAGDMVEFWDAGPSVPGWHPEIALEAGLTAMLEAGERR